MLLLAKTQVKLFEKKYTWKNLEGGDSETSEILTENRSTQLDNMLKFIYLLFWPFFSERVELILFAPFNSVRLFCL